MNWVKDWAKAATTPLGLAGFALALVFLYLRDAQAAPLWWPAASVALAFFCIAGGFSLAARSRPTLTGNGGAGGNARATGYRSGAEGGVGGIGGVNSGGRGGNAEAVGDYSYARGGDGGNAAQQDGRGGPRTLSVGERMNLPTQLWPYGYGGRGANTPEYDRRLAVLTEIRQEYLRAFPDDALFIHAGIEQVPIRWVNKRLEEQGEAWRVKMAVGGYLLLNGES